MPKISYKPATDSKSNNKLVLLKASYKLSIPSLLDLPINKILIYSS